MKKIWIIIIIVIITITFFLLIKSDKQILKTYSLSPTPSSSETAGPTPVNITAEFEIYTLGTKRVFADNKYHNLSNEVYIASDNPGTIFVNKERVTWTDFFATLPMKLDKSCLTTGTKQTFCTNENYTLKFFVNGNEDPNALDKEIGDGDLLKVVYE